MEYYLAIDIGASSGRHILGSIVDGKLVLEESVGELVARYGSVEEAFFSLYGGRK